MFTLGTVAELPTRKIKNANVATIPLWLCAILAKKNRSTSWERNVWKDFDFYHFVPKENSERALRNNDRFNDDLPNAKERIYSLVHYENHDDDEMNPNV